MAMTTGFSLVVVFLMMDSIDDHFPFVVEVDGRESYAKAGFAHTYLPGSRFALSAAELFSFQGTVKRGGRAYPITSDSSF